MLDMQKIINSFPTYIRARLIPFFYRKGETVIRKGDRVDYGYFIISGTFDTIEEDDSGKRFIIARDQSGFICMMDIFSGNEFQCASIITTSDCVGYKLSRRSCMELLESPCLFQPCLIKAWATKFYATTVSMYRYPIYRTKRKVVTNILLNGIEGPDGTVTLSVSRDTFAGTIGCSRRTLFRILSILKEDGIIETSGKKIRMRKSAAVSLLENELS